MILGTPDYMLQKYISMVGIIYLHDQIGCIRYELSCGRNLFETDEMLENYIKTGNIDKSHHAHFNFIAQKP